MSPAPANPPARRKSGPPVGAPSFYVEGHFGGPHASAKFDRAAKHWIVQRLDARRRPYGPPVYELNRTLAERAARRIAGLKP